MVPTSGIAAEAECRVRKMLLFVVRCLVDYPEDVEVTLVAGLEGSIFRIYVHPRDLGKLIGNNGQIEMALGCVVLASGRKLGQRLTIDIVQEGSPLR
jgi:predicted RNA-binding protein YlqC (UPF0109 family)